MYKDIEKLQLAAPHMEWRGSTEALSSALCDSGKAQGNGMELYQGELGKSSSPTDGEHRIGSPGQWSWQ